MNTHHDDDDRAGGDRERPVSLPRRYDDHSASRRVDVLLEQSPHLVAASRGYIWNLRAVLLFWLAVVAVLLGYLFSALSFHLAGLAGYYLACLLVIAAAIARGIANGEARR